MVDDKPQHYRRSVELKIRKAGKPKDQQQNVRWEGEGKAGELRRTELAYQANARVRGRERRTRSKNQHQWGALEKNLEAAESMHECPADTSADETRHKI